MATQLSDKELERFKRQLTLSGYTKDHQIKMKGSTALIAGIGGVGGTAALYLAIAGIGRLKLVHAGVLTSSNLNRQILMTEDWIGKTRVDCAKATIHRIASGVQVDIYNERMTLDNSADFVRDADVAVSARPNFPERCALNSAYWFIFRDRHSLGRFHFSPERSETLYGNRCCSHAFTPSETCNAPQTGHLGSR